MSEIPSRRRCKRIPEQQQKKREIFPFERKWFFSYLLELCERWFFVPLNLRRISEGQLCEGGSGVKLEKSNNCLGNSSSNSNSSNCHSSRSNNSSSTDACRGPHNVGGGGGAKRLQVTFFPKINVFIVFIREIFYLSIPDYCPYETWTIWRRNLRRSPEETKTTMEEDPPLSSTLSKSKEEEKKRKGS